MKFDFLKINPLKLLLKYEGYPPAVLVAVLLHGALLYFLLDKNLVTEQYVDVERPAYINATVIEENPQRLRRLELEQQQARERAREEEAAAQARAEEEARRQAEKEREEAQAEEERRRQAARQQAEEEEQARRRAEEEAARRERERQEQLAREEAELRRAAEQRRAEQAAAANQEINRYTAAIRDAVAANWSVPPSARNGMTVVLRLNLVPTGEVVSAEVVQSSGDDAFDRSAVRAVQKAERFPELQNMSITLFEREFRTLNLLFRPEDLLR